MATERDDQAPMTYGFASEEEMLCAIANELAELRRLTVERNDLIRESNTAVKDVREKRSLEARRIADAFELAASLEERVAKVEALAHPPVGGLARADDVEQQLSALREQLAKMEARIDSILREGLPR